MLAFQNTLIMELFPQDPMEELFAEMRRLLKIANCLIAEMKKYKHNQL